MVNALDPVGFVGVGNMGGVEEHRAPDREVVVQAPGRLRVGGGQVHDHLPGAG